ncbi:FAD-binding oxidoreductase [Aquibacillus salsiterrae]|uniref:FAD-binding oxidoreductase n=1 Tax=Aquibacillus salsiterrae TaxID=2950439 RepID=A0A9X3WC51_9BACI|nr:FAD-binding oxidoreductase [Aquibacillus salsiterrae]MDC3416697.1 FAD-binding oxidoreductase [Aquibacillus salsiterrae]
MVKARKERLSGWGNYPVQSGYVFRPEHLDELKQIVTAKEYSSYIAYGLGRSYGDTPLNRGAGVIGTSRLNHFIDFDEQTCFLTCEAGVTLHEIIDVFLPRGYYLPVTPGTKMVTVGGAIANDVHGKNHHVDGTFCEFVASFDLLTASGEIITCTRDRHADIFWATVGGIGLTGLILRATFKLIPVETAYINVRYEKASNLDEAFAKFQADADFTYSVAWIDCLASGDSLGKSVLMRGDHARVDDLPASIVDPLKPADKFKLKMPIHAPGMALNYYSISAFNKLYYGMYKDEDKLVEQSSFFHPLDAITDWNKMYGKNGFIQYQAVFPKHNNPKEGLRKLLTKLSDARRSSFLAVLKSSGPWNGGLLSFPVEGYTLALDIPIKDDGLFPFLRELDELVLDYGGRVYLAKDSSLEISAFQEMYPTWEDFLDVKEKVDPGHLFSSSMGRRLGLSK